MNLLIIMPVYEDWDPAIELCRRIDAAFRNQPCLLVSLLLIDDGSVGSTSPDQLPFRPDVIKDITVLVLRRNLGHQRAIAVGLAYIQQNCKADAVVVMDADGQDSVEGITAMIEATRDLPRPTAVFAARGKRLENSVFRVFYGVYRVAHRFLTGRDIRFGNFSVLPWSHLDTLVVFPELWNHYAATFLKSRLPYVQVKSDRGARSKGKSQMNFVGLVVHGLSALFANQEVVGTRLLVANMILSLLFVVAMAVVIGVRLFSSLAIPGWATTAMGLLLILMSQAVIACFVLVFSIIMNRNQLGFLPVRDYSYFIHGQKTLYSQ